MTIKIERFEKFNNDDFIGTIFRVIFNDLLIYESFSKKAAIEVANQIITSSLHDAIYAVVKRELKEEFYKKIKDYEAEFKKEKDDLKKQIVEHERNYQILCKKLAELQDFQEFVSLNFEIEKDLFFGQNGIKVSAFSGIRVQNYYRNQVTEKYSIYLDDHELSEFRKLLEYSSRKNLRSSSELSNLIANDENIKNKFSNLTGLIQMRDSTNTWIFNGGISPKIYKFICDELKLENNGSQAIPSGFQSYSDLNKPFGSLK